MSSGKKQFTLFAIAGGLFAAIMLTGVLGNVVRGNYLAIPLVLCSLALAVGLIWCGIWLNQRRIQMMFRNPTPDKLIANYHATLLQARARKIPYADAAAAHLSAVAAIIYGQFDRAREELATVDWDAAPAMYRGHRQHLFALMALLEKQDPAEALRLAAEADALEKTDPAGSLPVLHDAILVAAGEGDADAIKRTERSAQRQIGALPAISAWALSLYFERNAQPTEVEEYRKMARAAAPHFIALPPLPPA